MRRSVFIFFACNCKQFLLIYKCRTGSYKWTDDQRSGKNEGTKRSTVLEAVGGKENVKNFEHCATRLRLILKDDQLVDKDKAEAVEGSKGYFSTRDSISSFLEQEKSMKFIKPSQQKWAMTPPLIKLASKTMSIRICHPSKSRPHVVRCLGAIDSSFGNRGLLTELGSLIVLTG